MIPRASGGSTNVATLDAPGDEPTSRMMLVSDPEALHANVTIRPLILAISEPGADGGPVHGAVPIVTTTSFDGSLTAALSARTRNEGTCRPAR